MQATAMGLRSGRSKYTFQTFRENGSMCLEPPRKHAIARSNGVIDSITPDIIRLPKLVSSASL